MFNVFTKLIHKLKQCTNLILREENYTYILCCLITCLQNWGRGEGAYSKLIGGALVRRGYSFEGGATSRIYGNRYKFCQEHTGTNSPYLFQYISLLLLVGRTLTEDIFPMVMMMRIMMMTTMRATTTIRMMMRFIYCKIHMLNIKCFGGKFIYM